MSLFAHANSGICIHWGGEHRGKNGNLICRQASITPPVYPQCNCLGKYLWWLIEYWLLMHYHELRVRYAEANRYRDIPEYYRSGEPYPKRFWGIIGGIAKLKLRIISTPKEKRYGTNTVAHK